MCCTVFCDYFFMDTNMNSKKPSKCGAWVVLKNPLMLIIKGLRLDFIALVIRLGFDESP